MNETYTHFDDVIVLSRRLHLPATNTIMFSIAFVCVFVCNALSFESIDLINSFLPRCM